MRLFFYIGRSSQSKILIKYISLKHSSIQFLHKLAGGCSRTWVLVNIILYGFTCTYKVSLYKVASTKIKLLDQKNKKYWESLSFISAFAILLSFWKNLTSNQKKMWLFGVLKINLDFTSDFKFFQNIRLPIFLGRTHSEVLFKKAPREDAAHL